MSEAELSHPSEPTPPSSEPHLSAVQSPQDAALEKLKFENFFVGKFETFLEKPEAADYHAADDPLQKASLLPFLAHQFVTEETGKIPKEKRGTPLTFLQNDAWTRIQRFNSKYNQPDRPQRVKDDRQAYLHKYEDVAADYIDYYRELEAAKLLLDHARALGNTPVEDAARIVLAVYAESVNTFWNASHIGGRLAIHVPPQALPKQE